MKEATAAINVLVAKLVATEKRLAAAEAALAIEQDENNVEAVDAVPRARLVPDPDAHAAHAVALGGLSRDINVASAFAQPLPVSPIEREPAARL